MNLWLFAGILGFFYQFLCYMFFSLFLLTLELGICKLGFVWVLVDGIEIFYIR